MKCKGCNTEVRIGRACGAGNGLCDAWSAYCVTCVGEKRANDEMVEHVRLVHGGGIMQRTGEKPVESPPFPALRDQIIATAMAEWARTADLRSGDEDMIKQWDRCFDEYAEIVIRVAVGACAALDRYLKTHS